MPSIVASPFILPMGTDTALLPRTPELTHAYHELLVANQQRLARWERWAADSPTLEEREHSSTAAHAAGSTGANCQLSSR